MKKITRLSAASAMLGAICVIYYILCGAVYSFAMSGLWIWLAFGLVLICGFLWQYHAEPRIKGKLLSIYRPIKAAVLSLFIVFIAVFLFFEGLLIREWVSGYSEKESPDVLIVLGAGVEYDRPGNALGKRIGAAAEFIEKNPGITVIACGGLGTGDIITEADCIKRELVKLEVPEDNILTETDSTSTFENFLFSADLLPEDTHTAAIISSGYHLFRAKYTARTAYQKTGDNLKLITVSAPCADFLLPFSMVREFAAFTRELCSGNIHL